MDIPQFKDIIQKLSVFKRHSSLFVPVVIGGIGALLFIPTQLISIKLKARISDESIMKRGGQVLSLRQNTPAGDQWKVERERQQAYKNDANQISLLAKEFTQRQLLSDKIFPEPKDSSISLFKNFGQQFRGRVDEILKGVNAGECPTNEELKRSSGPITGVGRHVSGSLRQIAWRGAGPEIIDALCRSKAEAASVYINPINLSGYAFWDAYQYAGAPEAIEDCWYHQLACWIIEDVIDTIGAMNSNSSSVFTSPVKRLLNISFTSTGPVIGSTIKTVTMGPSTKSTAQIARDVPRYVLTIQDGLVLPCTGRVCNDDIDVVHFNVRVVISTKAVLRFMQQLCSAKQHIIRETGGQLQGPRYAKHNQITILESKITSIYRLNETHSLYRYGEDAVVELDLICEYVFSKKGYEDIKPETVKKSQMVQSLLTGSDYSRFR
jgi:hypothetical protein